MAKQEPHKLAPHLWVEKYGDFLFNYAIVRVNDQDQAEDLVQETFLAALKARDNFKGKSTERTWLVSILKRKIIDTYRRKNTSKESSSENFSTEIRDGEFYKSGDAFEGQWLNGKGPHSHSLLPEGDLEEEELMKVIRDCISRLPDNLAAAFVMKMIDEEESGDICKELDITPSNLWVMLHRARLKMRSCIENKWMT